MNTKFEKLADGKGVGITDPDGNRWILRALDPLHDFKEIEQHYATEIQQGPIEAIMDELEKLRAFPRLQDRLVDRAYTDLKIRPSERKPKTEDVQAWLDTKDGMFYVLWLCFRKEHPAMTLEQSKEILAKTAMAHISEMSKLVDLVNPQAAELADRVRAAGIDPQNLKPEDAAKVIEIARGLGIDPAALAAGGL